MTMQSAATILNGSITTGIPRQNGALQAQARGLNGQTAAIGEIRSFGGVDHYVVPVIAMVEGVRLGVLQTEPELGLAADFGRYPVAWNNRPLVVNHPVLNNQMVSAGADISILENFAFGFIEGTYVEDGKLKMNAWISQERAKDLPVVQGFIDQIMNGEMIEVSVGFFADVLQETGKFNGQSYAGVWKNIVPDHLAFLTDSKGACSNEDGCGVPRLQAAPMEGTMSNSNLKANCSCGGHTEIVSIDAPTPRTFESRSQITHEVALHNQAVADGITASSMYELLNRALRDHYDALGVEYYDAWVVTYTLGNESLVIFETWDNGYKTMGMKFDMDAQGGVTFSGEPFDVRLVTHVYQAAEQENDMTTPNSQTSQTSQASETPKTPVVQSQPPIQQPMSRTEVLALFSAADRAEIESALQLQTAQRNGLIDQLVKSGRCSLSEDFLKAQSLDTLNSLVGMLPVVNESAPVDQTNAGTDGATFQARPVPTPIQAQSNGAGFVDAPLVFARKQ